MNIIDKIIDKLRQLPPQQKIMYIYVSKEDYDEIDELVQKGDYDYNSPTIIALQSLQLVIDMQLNKDQFYLS